MGRGSGIRRALEDSILQVFGGTGIRHTADGIVIELPNTPDLSAPPLVGHGDAVRPGDRVRVWLHSGATSELDLGGEIVMLLRLWNSDQALMAGVVRSGDPGEITFAVTGMETGHRTFELVETREDHAARTGVSLPSPSPVPASAQAPVVAVVPASITPAATLAARRTAALADPDFDQALTDLREGYVPEELMPGIIERYLITPEQRALLSSLGISIPQALTGRFDSRYFDTVDRIFEEWNVVTGADDFGF